MYLFSHKMSPCGSSWTHKIYRQLASLVGLPAVLAQKRFEFAFLQKTLQALEFDKTPSQSPREIHFQHICSL